jgi:uncharacterized protein YpmS
MKISKVAWLIIGIGIFAIAAGSLYMLYSQQVSEQRELNERLAAAQTLLPQVTTQRDNLENQLSQVEARLQDAEANFPESVQSIEFGDKFFRVADDCGVAITSFTSVEPSAKKQGSVSYSVASFTVTVEGEVDDILDFINTIATDEYFVSTTPEVVSMEVPESDDEGEGEKSSATINLVVYGYQGE